MSLETGETTENTVNGEGLGAFWAASERAVLQKFKTHGKHEKIDGKQYWVVEGDILLDEQELESYVQQQVAWQQALEAARAAQEAGLELVGMLAPLGAIIGATQNNQIVRWAADV